VVPRRTRAENFMKRKFTQRMLKKAVNKIKISELDIRFRFAYIKVNDQT
jgi:hypothetical protein